MSMNQRQIDEFYMRRCLQLAVNGMKNARPNPMVGAVIVSQQGIIMARDIMPNMARAMPK